MVERNSNTAITARKVGWSEPFSAEMYAMKEYGNDQNLQAIPGDESSIFLSQGALWVKFCFIVSTSSISGTSFMYEQPCNQKGGETLINATPPPWPKFERILFPTKPLLYINEPGNSSPVRRAQKCHLKGQILPKKQWTFTNDLPNLYIISAYLMVPPLEFKQINYFVGQLY